MIDETIRYFHGALGRSVLNNPHCIIQLRIESALELSFFMSAIRETVAQRPAAPTPCQTSGRLACLRASETCHGRRRAPGLAWQPNLSNLAAAATFGPRKRFASGACTSADIGGDGQPQANAFRDQPSPPIGH
jgi:hypothetical protein